MNSASTGVPRTGGKRKTAPTRCLGCGTTETPEWRRGPMGPRTLCNACVSLPQVYSRYYSHSQGLVHMKLQKKKEKAELKRQQAEMEAAAALGDRAASGG